MVYIKLVWGKDVLISYFISIIHIRLQVKCLSIWALAGHFLSAETEYMETF